jgi:hypothetical protein
MFASAIAIGAFELGSLFFLSRESVDFVAARRQRNAPVYQLGTTISWQDQAPGALFGWYPAEPIGTWSAGPAAALAVKLPERPVTDLLLIVVAGAFVDEPELPARDVDVLVNRKPVAKWQFNSRDIVQRTARIPYHLVTDDLIVRVDFRFHEVHSPRELGLSPDSRRLTMRLFNWRLDALPQ